MQIRLAPVRMVMLLIAITLTAGCNRIDLAYRNLDFLIPWSLNDYLDLSRDQQKRFRSQLQHHLGWHCRTQLPQYLDRVERLEQQIRSDRIDEAALREHYEQARQAIQIIAVQITPSATRLLHDLNDQQVSELKKGLEKDRREHSEKYLEPPLSQQIDARAERAIKRVEHWLGSSGNMQRERIRDWARTLAEQNRYWLANRAQWQRALSDALDNRNEPGFETRIATLLQDRESLWTDDYRAAFARAEQATVDLLLSLYKLSDDTQRRYLAEQFKTLRSDLGSLACLSEED